MGRLDALAVDDTTGWSGLARRAFTIEHQADIMDGLKHETTHQPAAPFPSRTLSGQDGAAH